MVDVRGGRADVVIELVGAGDDDDRDLGVAEDGQLVGLLEETVASLGEGHLPVGGVLDPLDLDLPSSHSIGFSSSSLSPPPPFLLLLLLLLVVVVVVVVVVFFVFSSLLSCYCKWT